MKLMWIIKAYWLNFNIRYKVIKLKQVRAGEWIDTDERMIQAAEAMLNAFVEHECSNMADVCGLHKKNHSKMWNGINYLRYRDKTYEDDSEIERKIILEQRAMHKRIIKLFFYFRKKRKRLEAEVDTALTAAIDAYKLVGNQFKVIKKGVSTRDYKHALDKLYESDTAALIEMANIRGSLWT